MKVYAEIKEPATCPGCGRVAQPGDLQHISIAFGEGRHLRATFRFAGRAMSGLRRSR